MKSAAALRTRRTILHKQKLLLRYVDDIVKTVRSEPICVLGAANSLDPNLQITLEETISKGNLQFLDLNVNVSQDRCVTCNWYQKQTDTRTKLNYRSCATLYTEFLGVHQTGS